MEEESTLYTFHDGIEPPPEVTDNQEEMLNLINDSLIEFPEQIEQALAIFAHGILVNARNEYLSYEGPFTQIKSNSRNSEFAQRRLNLINQEISNIEKVQYLAENYQQYNSQQTDTTATKK